jgi:hypothetical protein
MADVSGHSRPGRQDGVEITAMGPKRSSSNAAIPGVTPVITVGSKKSRLRDNDTGD